MFAFVFHNTVQAALEDGPDVSFSYGRSLRWRSYAHHNDPVTDTVFPIGLLAPKRCPREKPVKTSRYTLAKQGKAPETAPDEAVLERNANHARKKALATRREKREKEREESRKNKQWMNA